MGYHFEAEPGGDHTERSPADGTSVDEAMKNATRQAGKAGHLLFDRSDSIKYGAGKLVAVVDQHGTWTKMDKDLRQWWAALSRDTQLALSRDPDRALTPAQISEVTHAGGPAIGAYWPGIQDAPEMRLPSGLAALASSYWVTPTE